MPYIQLQLRRGLSTTWSSNNPTLGPGEIGYETDTNKFKIGNGSTPWNSLPGYFSTSTTGGGSLGYSGYSGTSGTGGSGGSTGDFVFTTNSGGNYAAGRLSKTSTGVVEGSGSLSMGVVRTTGYGIDGVNNTLSITGTTGPVNDTALLNTIYVNLPNVSAPVGSNVIGLFNVTAGPYFGSQNCGVYGIISTAIARLSTTLLTTWSSVSSAALVAGPGPFMTGYAGTPYDINFAISILKQSSNSTGGITKSRVGILYDTDSISPLGIHAMHNGGSTSANRPSALIQTAGYFGRGIDLSGASFIDTSSPAVILGSTQSIKFSAGSSNPLIKYITGTDALGTFEGISIGSSSNIGCIIRTDSAGRGVLHLNAGYGTLTQYALDLGGATTNLSFPGFLFAIPNDNRFSLGSSRAVAGYIQVYVGDTLYYLPVCS